MYLSGFGTKKSAESALICFKEASNRGNIYATGHLISYFYQNKLFTKALGLAARYVILIIWHIFALLCLSVFLERMACMPDGHAFGMHGVHVRRACLWAYPQGASKGPRRSQRGPNPPTAPKGPVRLKAATRGRNAPHLVNNDLSMVLNLFTLICEHLYWVLTLVKTVV